MLTAFDHVNVRTANLTAMQAFYCGVLGLVVGKRPDFAFPGAWLYLGDQAYVHLVGVPDMATGDGTPALEHFAFRASDMAGFLDRLARHDVPHSVDPVPGFPVVQVNFRDPDGNHIHVDFDRAESAV